MRGLSRTLIRDDGLLLQLASAFFQMVDEFELVQGGTQPPVAARRWHWGPGDEQGPAQGQRLLTWHGYCNSPGVRPTADCDIPRAPPEESAFFAAKQQIPPPRWETEGRDHPKRWGLSPLPSSGTEGGGSRPSGRRCARDDNHVTSTVAYLGKINSSSCAHPFAPARPAAQSARPRSSVAAPADKRTATAKRR